MPRIAAANLYSAQKHIKCNGSAKLTRDERDEHIKKNLLGKLESQKKQVLDVRKLKRSLMFKDNVSLPLVNSV